MVKIRKKVFFDQKLEKKIFLILDRENCITGQLCMKITEDEHFLVKIRKKVFFDQKLEKNIILNVGSRKCITKQFCLKVTGG